MLNLDEISKKEKFTYKGREYDSKTQAVVSAYNEEFYSFLYHVSPSEFWKHREKIKSLINKYERLFRLVKLEEPSE